MCSFIFIHDTCTSNYMRMCLYVSMHTCICIRNVYIFKFFEPVQTLIFGSIMDCTFVARDDVCSRLRVLHRCDGVNVSGVFSHVVHLDYIY